MKLHSVVDTITNSSSVEFMIPNPDGAMTKSDFRDMMITAAVEDANDGYVHIINRLLEFLPNGKDVYLNYNRSEWHKETMSRYTQEDLILAATEWFDKTTDVTWTEFNIITRIDNKDDIPKRIIGIISAWQGIIP